MNPETARGSLSLAMHTSSPVHDCVAMAVLELREDDLYRYERVCLLTVDGSVYQLNEISVPHGANSLTLRAAAWTLKQERLGRWKMGHWHLVKSASAPAPVAR